MKKISDTAVCIFAHIRDDNLTNLLNDIKKNSDHKKYIFHFFIDFPKNKIKLSKHYSILKIINEFKNGLKVKITVRKKNIGLYKNILEGINFISKKYDKFIVLEDDLRVSKYFLKYMHYNLIRFKTNNKIYTISGYVFPKKIFKINLKNKSIFLLKRPNTWGWGSWSSKWEKIKFKDEIYKSIYEDSDKLDYISQYGNDLKYILRDTLKRKINSWAIKWTIFHILNNKFCIFPSTTFVNEVGFLYEPSNNKFKSTKFYHSKIKNFKPIKNAKLISENKNLKSALKNIYDFPVYKKLVKNFF